MDEIQQFPSPPTFLPYRSGEEPWFEQRLARLIQCGPYTVSDTVCSDEGWASFETCLICPDQWNVDFAGPVFAAPKHYDDERVTSLALQVTMQNGSHYPVKATGYAYDDSNELLGLLDLRYFRDGMPRALGFDVSAYAFPASTQFMIAFQVSGGGSKLVSNPPLITSVGLSAQISSPPNSDHKDPFKNAVPAEA
ncbi:MAG: hypothetical protein WCA85_31570 [Paraburkholderia sp.]|uniref:hypothetical protein n=1 Tax=Paraburkholderia sp. TaxID=1926495 RepID=UPI003C35653A